MANAIRYSTTGDTQSLKSGNFFFGVGDVGKGPSSATTYYNGITPVVSGYTIYTYNASQTSKISFASANSDSELVTITNNLSGQNFTTATQCLNWYVTQSNYVCVNKDYENIVTNGLVMNLDASYDPSYTSSGTTWYDLAYSGNNGTLVNGPTFNSANGGSIVFDGVDDYVSILNNNNLVFGSGDFTVSIWIKTPIASTGEGSPSQWGPIISKGCTTSAPAGTWWIAQSGILNDRIAFNAASTAGGTFVCYLQTPILVDGWHNVVVTRVGITTYLYTDGILTSTDTSSDSNLSSTSPIWIAATNPSATKRTSMVLAQTSIYNRALTPAEILQNYQATFTRFLGKNIVTNGLVQYLDAGYVNSYPTTGTTWTNVSGVSGATGTLTNGPTYSGGSINFDGVDDYVAVSNFMGSTSTFSVSHFIYLNTSQNTRTIFSNYASSGSNGWVTGIQDGVNNVVKFYLGNTVHLYSNTVLQNQSWYHVTVTYDNGNPKIYINGVLDASSSNTITFASSYGGNDIGRLGVGAQYFNGRISQLSTYNRALSSLEILQNYQAQFPAILGENIITNGLVLYLDAGYRTSYPTTGTIWNNVSGVSGGTGTLTNGPTYNSGNGGSIVFDGVNDYGRVTNVGITGNTSISFTFWGKVLTNPSADGGMVLYGTQGTANQVAGIYYRNTDSYVRFTAWGSAGVDYATGFLKDFNIWHYWSLVYNGSTVLIYRDGIPDPNGAQTRSLNFTTSVFEFGGATNNNSYLNQNISNTSIYNRALTQNEIQQNFNAQKSRYGL